MHPDDDAPTASTQAGNGREPQRIRRWQVLSISVIGAVAVITFILSLLIADAAGALRTIAYVAAGICAVIGVSFALTGSRR
ncbi:hypothetical protein [Occultella gossypii]|uniref:Uncharacterized protein n=1 Tax=Occultella gossypii TaxID=2800820 RepID=A0ABS7S3P7_9MICO|nr:hypothetical protein [Occultella gossypii]MBZ2194974.1 hypothetical protein [Occultella gossypii]